MATHPALTGLTDASLSNWLCSTHEGFETWPLSFEVLAIAEDTESDFVAPDGTTGAPYIIARGVTVVSDVTLAHVGSDTNPVGTEHTVRATVTEAADGPDPVPVAGALVTINVIAGPHAGTVGNCTTGPDGTCTFSYTGANPGVDTIEATFESQSGTQRSNRIEKTWFATGTLTVTKDVQGGAGTFTFDVDCSVDTFDSLDNPINGDGQFTVPGIPAGTTCTVTEDLAPLFDTTVDPLNGSVIVDAGGETVAFTNVRKAGRLTVVKVAEPDGDPGLFDLLIDGEIVANDVGDGSGPAQTVPTGSHIVSETSADGSPVAGYDTVLRCVDAEDNPVASPGGIVNVGDGQAIVCTFTNTRQVVAVNHLTVAVVGGDPTFALAPAVVPPFALDPGESVTFDDIPPGLYTLTMTSLEPGFVLDSITCGAATIAVNLPARSVVFEIGADESVTCDFVISEVDDDDGYEDYPGDSDFDFDTPFDDGDDDPAPAAQVAGNNQPTNQNGDQAPGDPQGSSGGAVRDGTRKRPRDRPGGPGHAAPHRFGRR